MYNLKYSRNKIERLYKLLNLQLPTKKNKKKNYEKTCIKHIPKAFFTNDLWAIDFMFDVDENGNKIKIFNVIDVLSKKVLTCFGDRSINSYKISGIFMELFTKYGYPKNIISDNGPEFRSKIMHRLLKNHRIKQFFIMPGKPWQNAYIESFNSRLREEFLNRNIFENLKDFRRKSKEFIDYYNNKRPHSSINYKVPNDLFKLAA